MAKPSNSNRRVFIVPKRPYGLNKQTPRIIREGFPFLEDLREMVIRETDGVPQMVVKFGIRGNQQIQKLPLSSHGFDHLWLFTKGRRIERHRYTVKEKSKTISVDIFQGELHSLILANVKFSSAAQAKAFTPPKWCSEEVTVRVDYRHRYLAVHGLPNPATEKIRVGALPFYFEKGKMKIVAITSQSGEKWIIPRGHLEENLMQQEVAVLEAVEEAGVIGHLMPGMRSTCILSDGRKLILYPLRVTTLLHRWPEKGARKRRVMSLDQATTKLHEPELRRAVKRLATKIPAPK